MPRVPRNVIEHKLSIWPDARPVKQKARRFTANQKEALRKEINMLLEAGFIQQVQYPEWLANPVMVRKHNGG